MGKRLFDYVTGNPPYQQETTTITPEHNNQIRTKSIFPLFQEIADKIAKNGSVLIYPGARWLHRSGKGMAKFGYEQINDIHLARIDYYPEAKELFPTAAIADGITIVTKNNKKNAPGFVYVYHKANEIQEVFMDNPGEDLIPLMPNDAVVVNKIEKFVKANNLDYLHDRVMSQKMFGIESDFVEAHPDKVRPYIAGESIRPDEVKLFTNDKAGKAGRAKWFVTDKAEIKANSQYIDYWKVIVSSANAGGQKRDNQLEIVDNHSAFGRARVALGVFKTKQEAENFYKYVNSYLVKFAFLMTDENLTSLAKRVPDIGDYTEKSKHMNFSKNIDEQFQSLLNLTDSEMTHIKNRVNSLRGRK